MVLPDNRKIRFLTTCGDVIHSCWVAAWPGILKSGLSLL
jgi:heme/copper-type cytochrome/quinol oxidase subunit 2